MKSIGVKNLRSLKDIGMVEIKPITVLVGKNSSGKSSFLRLFPLLKQTLEAKTAEPILWYGKYVDFGDYDLSRTHSETADIELRFDLELSNILPRYYTARNRDVSKKMDALIFFGIKKQGVSFISVEIKKQKFNLFFDKSSNIEKVEVNGCQYSGKHFVNYSSGSLLPEIMMREDSEEGVFRSDYDINFEIQSEIVKCLKCYANPKTKDGTIAKGVSPALFGSPEEILKQLQNSNAFSDGMKRKLAKINVEDEDFKKINDLITLATIPLIMRAICSELEAEIYAVRYSKPLRLNAARYKRIQGLAVDEVDPSGENLEMVLTNLNDKEKKQFSEWTDEIFGVRFSTISKDGHVSVIVEDSKSHTKENLVDTGFGYSQILPILLSVWKVNTSEKVPYGRVRYGYMTKARCYYEAIEQPELHLHPALQAKLINTFAQLVATENNRKIKFIMETHSETMINQLGYLICKKRLLPEMVNIVLFEKQADGNTKVTQVQFNEKGQLEKWPIGFFDPDEV